MTTAAMPPTALIRNDARAETLVNTRIVLAFFLASYIYFLIALLAGLLFSLQFMQKYPFPTIEWLSPGRIRFLHTNGMAYGFIANAFLGGLHWAIPRLTLRPVLSVKLSWIILVAWQGIVLATVFGLLTGQAQAVEWGETPTWVDPFAVLGLLLVGTNFLAPIIRMRGSMYVSVWYFMAALIWTLLTYTMGNFFVEYWIGGTASGAIIGLFIHDLVGLFVTPIGWGLMYYFVPIILRKPIWSHGLSLVGFWGLAFFYPLNGIHHFLYTPIPMFLQHGAIVATIAVEFVVTTVIINFFMTIRGSGGALRTNMPIRWFYVGMVFYFTTCLQCAFQVTLTFQKIIHFTDWVVGHAHLVMFGVFGFWILGMMTYLFPRLVGAQRWYSSKLNEWHFWLSAVGMLLMFFDLTIAGLIQGTQWQSLAIWEESVRASMPFWATRTYIGSVMIFAQFLFMYNMCMTAFRKPQATDEGTSAAASN